MSNTISFLFFILMSIGILTVPNICRAEEVWPGLSRVQRDGKPSNYAVQTIEDMEKSEIVSQFSLNPEDLAREPDQSLDLEAQDEFNKALKTIETNTKRRIEASAPLTSLLRKDSWTVEDRVQWEHNVATMASEERHRIPGLGSYRSIFNREFHAQKRPARINDLSIDIRDGSEVMEFDCEQMTAVDGIILGRLEKTLLPQNAGGLKRAVSYARSTGYIYMEFDTFSGVKDPSVSGHHVFLLSPLTGNIIEATANPLANEVVYRIPMTAWSGMKGYLRGASTLIHAEKKFIHYTSLPDDKAARAVVGAAKQGSYIEQIPALVSSAKKELDALTAILMEYRAKNEIQRLGQILATDGKGLSAPEADEIRGILKTPAIRDLKGAAAEKVRIFRFRLGNLRYLQSRLQRDEPLREVQAALVGILSQAKAELGQAVFDVETASVTASDPGHVLKEKLSGKYRIRVPLNAYPDADKLPIVRAVSAEEDINLDLNN